MNCPRCKTAIPPLADPDTVVTCPGCGSRLMTRSAALRSQGGKNPRTILPAPPAPASPPAAVELPPPSATLPPTPARLLGLRRMAEQVAPKRAAKAEPAGKGRQGAEALAQLALADLPSSLGDAIEQLVREVRALRSTQEHILGLLERGRRAGAVAPASSHDEPDSLRLSPIRASRRKSVVLIDDDPATRAAAVAELEQSDVPVRAFDDGSEALSAIAQEKPDVLVLELGLGGEMAGKDLINVIKATMEWVDLPIVLWTREQVSNQKEARQIHGADEIVPKEAGAAALLARVITVFRRV